MHPFQRPFLGPLATVFLRSSVLAVALVTGPSQAQTLVVANSALPTTLDSADAQDVFSQNVAINVTEPLIGYGDDGTELAPLLATGWRPNDDATVWTLTLRQGVRFHDGTPFDADAVKFNLDRWNEPDHPHAYRDQGKTYVPWRWVFGGVRSEGGLLEEVRVLDTATVRLVLREPVAFLPALLAAPFFQIDSPAAVRAAGAAYGTPAVGTVGTGPFRFAEWREGERVVLERHDGYWGEPARVGRIVSRGVPDATARLAELLAGTVDIALSLDADAVPLVRERSDLRLVAPEAELNVGFVAMNQDIAPFGDVRVRRAVAYAVDREAIVDAFYGPFATLAVDFLPPLLWGHAELEPYRYDPARARALLAEAGLADGFTTELWYVPVSSPLEPAPRAIAETIASYLADVGITARPRTKDWNAYLADATAGRLPLYMLGWAADYADPDSFLRTFFGASRYASPGWDDEEVVAWVERARRSTDVDERAALYARVLRRAHEQVPALPTVHARSVNGVRATVSGFEVGPIPGALRLSRVAKASGD